MISLASGGHSLRFAVAFAVTLAWANVTQAAESAKSVEDAIAASKKSGKAILTLLGSET